MPSTSSVRPPGMTALTSKLLMSGRARRSCRPVSTAHSRASPCSDSETYRNLATPTSSPFSETTLSSWSRGSLSRNRLSKTSVPPTASTNALAKSSETSRADETQSPKAGREQFLRTSTRGEPASREASSGFQSIDVRLTGLSRRGQASALVAAASSNAIPSRPTAWRSASLVALCTGRDAISAMAFWS